MQGKYNEAIVELQELAATGVKDPSLYIDLSRAQVAAGNPQMALQQLRSILAFDAENIQARLMMGAVYLQQKKFDSAIQTTREILKDDPENVGARHLLTAAYLASGRYENASEEMSEVARLSPDSPFGLISQSLVAMSEGRYRDSGDLAQNIIDQQPQEPTGYNLLGLSLMEQKDWQPAVANFRKAVELNPDFMAPYQNLARLYMNIRRPDMAIAQLRAALEQKPDQISFRLLLADLLVRLGASNWDRALGEYDIALTEQPDNISALLGIARINLGKGDYPKVEEIAQKILNIESGQNQALLLLADTYIRQGLYRKALETFSDFSKLYPDQLPGHRGKAFCEVITGDLAAADRTLKAAQNLIPGALELQLDHAVILQLEGEYDRAVSGMKQVIAQMDDPKHYDLIMANMFLSRGLQTEALNRINTESNQLMGVDAAYRQFAEGVIQGKRYDWPARLNLAIRFLRVGWTREAEKTIRDLSSETKDLSLVWSLQGQILLAQKKPEESQECYEKALDLESGYFGIHLYLADLARGFSQDLPKALQHHQALLKAAENPNHPFYLSSYVQIGRLYDLMGDRDQAIANYSHALRIDPNYFSALNNLAYLYSEQGKLDDALLYAEKARDISPYNGAVLDTLGWIYYLKDQPSEALENMRVASALLPFEPTVQFHLGKTLMANQKDALALRAFRRSLILSQNFPERGETERLTTQLEDKLKVDSTEQTDDSSSGS